MQQIGVRELKNQATEIIRDVREQHAEYIVTYRGRPVAKILPVDKTWEHAITTEKNQTLTLDEIEAELDEIGREMAIYWPAGVTATQAVAEQRR